MPRLTVGLTGGLASGKTTVLNFFHQWGIETLSADLIVHTLMQKNSPAYTVIRDHFGENVLNPHQEIDRSKLRSLVFNSPKAKHWLENYLHPLVRQTLLAELQKISSPYAVIEIPLLAETQTPFEWINRILVIDSDEKTQQLRAEKRSGLSLNDSKKILDQQATREKRNSIAHDIVLNNRDLAALELEVKALHNKYLQLSDS